MNLAAFVARCAPFLARCTPNQRLMLRACARECARARAAEARERLGLLEDIEEMMRATPPRDLATLVVEVR